METETISIASAVVVPPQDDIQERVKRRQPPSELSEASKRLRLSHDESGNDSGTTKDINDGSRATAERLTEEPSLRRKTGADEERKRGKRLFGALLGTIGKFQKETSSQRARSNAVKRREVEAKLEEKMKLQTEELDEQRKKDNENLNLRKRIERREFEERTMELRHNSLLAQANMLATSATPKLV
ncbi:pinin/SDK/memA/ protein conserved region-domain-containing protein [Geopyxis carbonaria]|nr:pinin/SDK/memA/ protein conserved region-domain-containing protein [Geopyxis carbonaria]